MLACHYQADSPAMHAMKELHKLKSIEGKKKLAHVTSTQMPAVWPCHQSCRQRRIANTKISADEGWVLVPGIAGQTQHNHPTCLPQPSKSGHLPTLTQITVCWGCWWACGGRSKIEVLDQIPSFNLAPPSKSSPTISTDSELNRKPTGRLSGLADWKLVSFHPSPPFSHEGKKSHNRAMLKPIQKLRVEGASWRQPAGG